MESYSLYQLNEYIRRVIALNFREPIWIEAEIAQVKDSRGNFYLELVEKEEDSDDIKAQVSAALWYRKFQFIKRKIGNVIYDLLTDGTSIRFKCNVEFHERYGLKLIIEDIDPNYTFGKLELRKQEIINRLEEEGLMDLNKGESLPNVIQKIAVISSSSAAGYQDFINQLTKNEYGYTFSVDLYDSAVQGVNVERDTISAITQILDEDKEYHAVAIIRGGGSKLDLSGYDNFEIAKTIALSGIPFIIGIGHDIDNTVTDLISCLSLKTPTAVANYIIDKNGEFESRMELLGNNLHREVTELILGHRLDLQHYSEKLARSASTFTQGQFYSLESHTQKLESAVHNCIRENQFRLENIQLLLDSRDPINILNQGFAHVSKKGTTVKSVKDIEKGDDLMIQISDGFIQSKAI